jgi:hypothetical protein
MSFDAAVNSLQKLAVEQEEEEEVVQVTDQAPEFEIDLGTAFAFRHNQ